ncbi:SHQ1-domain-containing protein [Collybia nuda]|uniref:SHQ1-domain-containing protein n=1 Tax=Collybia nuda TaxID=64659 RepID=A0A9P6CN35_9AGAR|nr:SHQ1-domain-containing protein [Collybia nuda]
MITPRFTCTQTEETVIISIYCPSVRAADVEIHVDETLVSVHINPYFLRLNFSYPLLEDDDSSARYDPSSGHLTVTLTKENKGQEFTDLDLLAKLLAPRPSVPQPSVEVLSRSDEDDLVEATYALSLDRQEILQAAQNDWQLPQEIPGPYVELSAQKRYGFLDIHSGYFKHVTHTENEVNELGADAETCTHPERRKIRLKHEDEKWDEEYYMADYADNEHILDLLKWKHPHAIDNQKFQYTEEENATILRLPRREYLPTLAQTHGLYLTLITLLFSYAYESRTTQHDPTPESAWTLGILIPAFSSLDPPGVLATSNAHFDFSADDLSQVLVSSYRRSLAFPLYRSFILAEACHDDVGRLLSKGKRTIVRCLLEMKNILDHHDVYYVYSKVWLDDFCVWVQAYASDDILIRLGIQLREVKITKAALGWNLEALEAATRVVQGRVADSDDESGDDSD